LNRIFFHLNPEILAKEVAILPLEVASMWSCYFASKKLQLLLCHMTSTRDSYLSMCFCACWWCARI